MEKVFLQPGFTNIIALLATAQGIILFSFLFHRRKNKSNLYLSFYILLLSLNIAGYSDSTYGVYIRHPYLVVIADLIPFIHIPLMYFYFFYTLHRNLSPRFPLVAHLIPAAFHIVIVNGIYFYVGPERFKEIIAASIQNSQHPVIVISNWSKFALGVIYSGFIINMIRIYAKNSNGWRKNRTQKFWLITLSTVIVLCWIVVISTGAVIYIYKMQSMIVKIFLVLELITLAAAMYMITYFTFRYPYLFPEVPVRNKIAKKLNLDQDKIASLEIQWNVLMNRDQYFLEETANLQQAAQRLNTHPNVVSYFVNEKFGLNFNEYLNDLRLGYFLELIKKNRDRTILDLAYESGFASKTTFNRVFKEKFHITPAEYRNNFSNAFDT